MRVSQGGHDVPAEKLSTRFPRIMNNLQNAIQELHNVWIFDNDDLRTPFRLAAVCEDGQVSRLNRPVPDWLRKVLPRELK
jgi:predicted ABC-type ATPase